MAGEKVVVTGAAGIGGQDVCRLLAAEGYTVRLADIVAPPLEIRGLGEFVRCDTRTPDDAHAAMEGMDAVVHLAAWHCAHEPPVSDPTIFGVNVGGAYNVLEAAKQSGVRAALDGRVDVFMTIVHTDHGMPPDVVEDFGMLGADWLEEQLPGARALISKYGITLPDRVEQHDLSEVARLLGWRPCVGFLDFLRDLQARDARGEDVQNVWAPGRLP